MAKPQASLTNKGEECYCIEKNEEDGRDYVEQKSTGEKFTVSHQLNCKGDQFPVGEAVHIFLC